MNTIFETYSDVYSTALMQNVKPARSSAKAKRGLIARLFGRA